MILAIALAGLIGIAGDQTFDPVLDAKFKCPKEYPNFNAYMVDLFAWNDLAKQRHPDWTGAQITGARKGLFAAHHCPPPPAQP